MVPLLLKPSEQSVKDYFFTLSTPYISILVIQILHMPLATTASGPTDTWASARLWGKSDFEETVLDISPWNSSRTLERVLFHSLTPRGTEVSALSLKETPRTSLSNRKYKFYSALSARWQTLFSVVFQGILEMFLPTSYMRQVFLKNCILVVTPK